MNWWWVGGAAAAGAAYFLTSSSKASAADINALLGDEEPHGPLPTQGTLEDPIAAAQTLAAYLRNGGKFGTRAYPSQEVVEVQRVLQVADDGIVGPLTRAAALRLGVQIPFRPGLKKQPPTPASTVTPAARSAGSVEPQPAAVPREQKGSLVARVALSGLPFIATVGMVKKGLLGSVNQIGRSVSSCPGSPRLVGSPSLSVTKKGGAMLADMRWPAVWSSTGVSPQFKSCLARKLQTHEKMGKYYAGMKVTRS